MCVKINKEGLTRYKRQYFFPNTKGSFYKLTRPEEIRTDIHGDRNGHYLGNGVVAEFRYKIFAMVFNCRCCGLQMYGLWYRNEEFTCPDHSGVGELRYINYLPKFNLSVGDLWKQVAREKEAYSSISNRIEAEISSIRTMKTCPICGGSLSEKHEWEEVPNYASSYNYNNFIESSLKNLVYNPRNYPATESREAIQQIKETSCAQKISIDARNVANTPELLQTYIKHLLNTEATVHMLEERLCSLYASSRNYQEAYIRRQAEEMASIAETHYYSSTNMEEPTMNDVVLDESMPVEPRFTEKPPVEPIYEKPGLFNKKKIQAQNEWRRSNYAKNCQAYQQKLSEHQKALDEYKILAEAYTRKKAQAFLKLLNEYNSKTKAERTAFVAQIDNKKTEIINRLGVYVLYNETIEEIKRTEKLLSESYSCLKSLYNCGVIYEKYHNPVALASFYDYFASGRCTSLIGADGAYNLFESEVRMDLIITKLDVVVEKLDRIQKNQYALYSVMSEMNANLNALSRTASAMSDSLKDIKDYQKNISDNTAVIAHNTAVTAFYTKKNAELTDALGFMVALK